MTGTSFVIGIVGKPSAGKTSFTNAACFTDFKVGSYPFTTIDPNFGVAYVRHECVCKEFGVKDEPQNSICIDGIRHIPVKIIDVAGLVPDAWQGRGLGNKFLNDLSTADVLIHVVDVSGSLDEEGRPVSPGSHDPIDDILFLEREINQWMLDIVRRDWRKITGRMRAEHAKFEVLLAEKFAGLAINKTHILKALRLANLNSDLADKWSDEELEKFIDALRRVSKQIIIAANKIDMHTSEENLKRIKERFPDLIIIPTCSLCEYILKNFDKKGIISYTPGDSDFKILRPEKLSEKELGALEKIRTNILQKYGSTGVQKILETAVFDVLKMITVYPVNDPTALTDSKGRVLPDVYLVPEGTTAREFAGRIHTDLAKSFLYAIDARTKMRLGEKHVLKDRDVIKIVSTKGT